MNHRLGYHKYNEKWTTENLKIGLIWKIFTGYQILTLANDWELIHVLGGYFLK